MESQIAHIASLLEHPNPDPGGALMMLNPLAKKENTPWPVFHYIGMAYIHKKDFKTALRWLQKSRSAGSDAAISYHLMSVCHYSLASFEEAEKFEKKALEEKSFYKGWMHLATIYREQAKLKEALECYNEAVKIEPDNTGITLQIAEIYRDQGRLDKALDLYSTIIEDDDKHNYAAYGAMAQVLLKKQEYEKAEEYLKIILKTRPDHLQALICMSDLYRQQGEYSTAMKLCEKLLESHPKAGNVRLNYAVCLQELGKFSEAEQYYKRALQLDPNLYQSLSNYLMCIHYNPEQSKEDIFEAHKLWDQHFAPENRPERPIPQNIDPAKKLRVGLISGGFKMHPVGWMITKGLGNLPSDQFEIYCYTTDNKHDFITHRISNEADKWQSVIGYNDEIIAQIIREDEIDILVELSGHAADNRLRTIALEPAPIIAKWVGGLFNTTGLRSVDYLITDQYESPAGEEEYYTEKLVRMPDDYICYLPPHYAPEVGDLSAKEKGYVTFGCFNNSSKINNEILGQWAKILNRVADSRLLLKSKQYDTEALRNQVTSKMEGAGISKERIIFKGQSNHKDHLSYYNQVDVALDPWPYSGGVTTCEALWMGVPVISKPGPTFAGRHSATHLTNAGFAEWIVDSWDEYVETAVRLAENQESLAQLRQSMREQVRESTLCNGQRFGAHLSAAFRTMWKQWVEGHIANNEDWQNHVDVKALSEEEINDYTVMTKVEKAKSKTGKKESEKSLKANVAKEQQIASDQKTPAQNSSMHSITTDQEFKNGISSSNEKNADQHKIFNIETKDDVTVCTPPDLNMLTPYVLLEQEEWFEPELAFVRSFLKPGMNIVDVGAGFGAYALPMAKFTGVGGTVYAFEPGSVARQHLEMSKAKNKLQNLEIIGRAVSDQAGEGPWQIAETPELNKVDEAGTDKVSQTTLDAWWKFENQPQLDFIKVDVNGKELEVLQGALDLLGQHKPVLLIAIGEANQVYAEQLGEYLEDKRYGLYEFIPGPQLLSEYDVEAGSDPYLMNLVAVHEDRKEELKKEGWIYDESVEVGEPEAGLWEKVLKSYPWAKSILTHWQEKDSQNESYLRALDCLCAAEQIGPQHIEKDVSLRSVKGTLLIQAVQQLVQLYNNGSMQVPVALSLARGLYAIGKRAQAVEVLNTVMEQQQALQANLPFLLPLPEQDEFPVKTDFNKWLTVRLVEGWLRMKNVSTYFSGERELNMLNALEGNPEKGDRTHKKNLLVNIYLNNSIQIEGLYRFKLNNWFWKDFQKGVNGLGSTQNTPSKIIEVKVSIERQSGIEETRIKIPEKEVFRLENIFNDHEYALPEGFQVNSDGVVVDVGANIGAFALYAKQWHEDISIFCFEPNPQVFPLLEANTKSLKNINKQFVALGDCDGELELSQHPVNTGQSTTTFKVKGGNTLKVPVKNAGQALKEAGVQGIDVLKIDTEGAEISILRGLEAFLPYTKIVMIEYHSENDRREIDKLLGKFHLYSAEIQQLWGVGTVKYINGKLLEN